MKVTVNLPRAPLSLVKNIRCNGNEYPVPFPHSTHHFIEIIQTVEVAAQHQKVLAILSKKANQLDSIEQFYRVQEDCLHYFNTKIELNTTEFVLTILAEPDKALQQLDKLKFTDLLTALNKGYDSLSVKLHPKLFRRIKKYLDDSKRNQSEQKQIRQFINLIKQGSSEDEARSEPVFLKSIEKVDSITLPGPKDTEQKKPATAFKKEKGYESDEEKSPQIASNQYVSQKSEIVEGDKPTKINLEKVETKRQHNNHKHNNKGKQDDGEDEWQDIKQEKENKRRAKNAMKRHLKNEQERPEEQSNEANEEEQSEPTYKENKPKKNKYQNEGEGRKIFGNFKEKPQRDMRVLLGINGDTDDGWRERYRVSIVPQFENRIPNKVQKNGKEKNEQSDASERSSKTAPVKPEPKKLKVVAEEKESIQLDNVQLTKSEVIKIEAKPKSLTKLFTYPEDGKTYTLNANQCYNILVNKLFWVKLQTDKVIIQKVGPDASGFIRICKFKSSEDYLLQTEDLTLSLSGMSNLEDGGIKFGNPVIKDFTQNDGQWFKVRDLQVFGYV